MTDDSLPPYRLHIEGLNMDVRTDRAEYTTVIEPDIATLRSYLSRPAPVAFICDAPRNVLRFGARVVGMRPGPDAEGTTIFTLQRHGDISYSPHPERQAS